MSKKNKPNRPKAARPRGFADSLGENVRTLRQMRAAVSEVFEVYGFEPLVTPAFEFSDVLGKFLPDADRPNEGVFSLRDDDERWLSLRYDLTAPLARFVAENYDGLTKPFRRYQEGLVWRNEKPGPGRFREFMQMDADTVGTANVAADAEMAMLAADCLEALGIGRADYVIRINNRKLMDAVLEKLALADNPPDGANQRLVVMRAIDKLDRLGTEGVAALLGRGRMDGSGDFTKGASLTDTQISTVMDFVGAGTGSRDTTLAAMAGAVGGTQAGDAGLAEMEEIDALLSAAGFDADRVVIDPSVVRGLGYYTGPVLEAELTFEAPGDDGPASFGSVGGGGRYDDLVARFRGQPVPATGFSIGLSRLAAALEVLKQNDAARATSPVAAPTGPVVVLVMDRDQTARYQAMARDLRQAGIRAEMYLGTSGMRAQMKYADRRGAPVVVIEGEDERGRGEIMIKDLVEGARLSAQIEDNVEWREGRPAQVAVPRAALVETVREILGRHRVAGP